MQLYHDGHEYIFACKYDDRNIPKEAGFKWDPQKKVWWTRFDTYATRLERYADDSAKKKLEKANDTIKESFAVSADICIPAPENFEYFPFQKAGIKFMDERDGVLLADEMGTGKTIQVIGLINLDTSLKNIIIICPATMKLVWKSELEKWLTRNMTIGVVNGGVFPTSDIVILNYDILHKHEVAIRERKWDLRVCDEAHYIKNPKTRRTKHILGEWNKKVKGWNILPIRARKRVFLTGTPIVNRPIELWPILRALDPDTWSNWKYFTQRYCNAKQTRWGYDVTGASNMEELGKKLRSTIMMRRLKKDVLKELPSKTRQVIEVPADSVVMKILDRENYEYDLRFDKINELERAAEQAEKTKNEARYQELVQQLKEQQGAAFAEMSAMRHEIAKTKIPIVIKHLGDLLENEQKVVVFAHHKIMVDALHEKFPNSVTLTGSTPQNKRQENIEKFQNDPSCLLFIGNIKAAGMGITLTASSHCVFAELSWVPGEINQCEDRLLRIGQKNNVTIQHLVYEGSLDARMAKTIIAKQNNIDKILAKNT